MTEAATIPVAAKASKSQTSTSRTSANSTTAEMIYPSIAASKAGRAIGMLLNSIPLSVGRHRLSVYLFALPIAPIAAAVYGATKAIGVRYRLSEDSIEMLPMIGDEVKAHASVKDIADIKVTVRPGQAFHRAGDVQLIGRDGESLLTMEGMVRPERVRAAILDVRESEKQISDVFETLRVRTPIEVLQAQAAKEKAEAAAKKKAAAEKKAASDAAKQASDTG